jgi:hypothetical protein
LSGIGFNFLQINLLGVVVFAKNGHKVVVDSEDFERTVLIDAIFLKTDLIARFFFLRISFVVYIGRINFWGLVFLVIIRVFVFFSEEILLFIAKEIPRIMISESKTG